MGLAKVSVAPLCLSDSTGALLVPFTSTPPQSIHKTYVIFLGRGPSVQLQGGGSVVSFEHFQKDTQRAHTCAHTHTS